MNSFAPEPGHVTEIRRQLSRWVAEKMPREKRREWDKAATWDRSLFKELAEMGLIGLTIPEEHGGQGEDIYAAAAKDLIAEGKMKAEEGTIRLENGFNVWYRRLGEASATPLLLLHGGPGAGHD